MVSLVNENIYPKQIAGKAKKALPTSQKSLLKYREYLKTFSHLSVPNKGG